MNNLARPKDAATEGIYPIRTVSDLTGVNAITLRAWERRYGLIEPVRKESGHRLYTQEHIDLINRIVGLLDRGMRIGQVSAQLEAEQARAESETEGDAWSRYLNRMVASVIRFDEQGLEETYGEALSLHPVESVTAKLLAPLLRELGRRWEKDEGGIAEEHFFGFYLRNKLGARFHHRTKARGGRKLLLACLPGDRHETGLLLFALAANEAGFETVMLGADMPLDELAAAARKTESAAIVLSGLVPPERATLKSELPALVIESEVPVFVGGPVSVTEHDAIHRAGAEALGTDLDTGMAHLNEILAQSASRGE
ncbi:MAG: MerR family transcriptional regulator [Xanthomonadales bacterium]|nr:MerR family transcriptional regulator [Xanthomonadales bacterium]NIX13294.1 MerR family transcriptional regulator [Xanthomonadales bacterium]